MRDIANKTIKFGDRVVTTYRNYSDLYPACVVGFTPQKVKVVLDRDYEKFVTSGEGYLTKYPSQIAVI